MNIRHTFSVGLLIVLVAAGSVAAYKFTEQKRAGESVTPPEVVSPSPVPPPTESVSQTYENEYMRLTVPAGWTLEELVQTASGLEPDKLNAEPVETEPAVRKTGAVRITKGEYMLTVQPQAVQASGVTGGRFAEVAMGTPSVDAVVIEQPSPPCGEVVTGRTVSASGVNLTHKEIYVSAADKQDNCVVPTSEKPVWYFSYLTDAKGGYFNYYKAGEPEAYVITMGYAGTDVNAFPQRGGPELTVALSQMTGIVQTLELKRLGK